MPEPIRSALLDGALWWNEAFEAAGYRNAFRVAMLPDGADPMDVRYNTIQWVHRSTRGWSYGYSVIDPRTGEIIKGHVTLGSLRVRQDFMIAEGLLGPYADDGDSANVMLDMALARFSENHIRHGRPLATIEEVLVPLYLLHRFQIAAVGKLIGGSYFSYALKGDGQKAMRPVAAARQQRAIEALLRTLQPSLLLLPDALVAALPPRPPGYPANRELFSGYTGGVFDPLAPAAAAAELTLRVLLDPARAARMNRNGSPTFRALIERLLAATWHARPGAAECAVHRQTGLLALDRLLALALDRRFDPGVAGRRSRSQSLAGRRRPRRAGASRVAAARDPAHRQGARRSREYWRAARCPGTARFADWHGAG